MYDEVIPVQDEDAFQAGRDIAQQEGILVGISAGAALWAAVQLAQKDENAGKIIVVLLPDARGPIFVHSYVFLKPALLRKERRGRENSFISSGTLDKKTWIWYYNLRRIRCRLLPLRD